MISNEWNNKQFMLVGDKSIPEMHLSQTGFILIPFESFEYKKSKIKYINLKEEDICMMHVHHGKCSTSFLC